MSKGMSLDKMMGGKLRAMFNREINRVATNIYDANTSPTAKRKIIMTMTISPDEERRIGVTDVSFTSRLCPVKSIGGKFVFGFNHETNEGEASELNAEILGQIGMYDIADDEDGEADEDGGNVVDLRKIKKGDVI